MPVEDGELVPRAQFRIRLLVCLTHTRPQLALLHRHSNSPYRPGVLCAAISISPPRTQVLPSIIHLALALFLAFS